MPDVRDCLAQYFVGDRSNITFTKKQEAKNIHDGVPLFPFEVNMWNASCGPFNMDQESRNRVCHNGTACVEDAVVAKCFTFDCELLIKFRRIGALHLQKNNLGTRRKAMDRSDEAAETVENPQSWWASAFEG